MDTLRSRRSLRWLGHGLGLAAVLGFLWIDSPDNRPFATALWAALALSALEALLSLADARARKLAALAPGAFPFKNLSEDDRLLVQESLLGIPKKSALRAGLAWALSSGLLLGAMLAWGRADLGVQAMAGLALGLPVSAVTQYLGNTVFGRRVAPFYYFEGDSPDELSKHLPSLGQRFLRLSLLPWAILLPAPLAAAAFQAHFSAWLWAWLLLWALAAALGARRVFSDVVVAPIEDLGSALGKLGEGKYDGLLDVTSGDELGVATNRFNKALRATDRRFFIRENFGHALPEAFQAGLLEGGLKLDGEQRLVVVLACRMLNGAGPCRRLQPLLPGAAGFGGQVWRLPG